VADTRECERCGKLFEPKREHARFCSARCRVAWNREHVNPDKRVGARLTPESTDDPHTQESALAWSIIAMRETTERLGKVRAHDRPQAFAVIGEAVWWVTIVDATLVRYHPEAYETALAGLPRAQRLLTEGTFAGLRYVRNRMGYFADHADFIQPRPSAAGDQDAPIAAWTWKAMSKPPLDTLPPRGQAWEMNRYWAYQERLAGHAIGETFNLAADFLTLASSDHAA
jgi:endogenous inhibitor of DNA gyrase (YacG/DUF329 family)